MLNLIINGMKFEMGKFFKRIIVFKFKNNSIMLRSIINKLGIYFYLLFHLDSQLHVSCVGLYSENFSESLTENAVVLKKKKA